MENKKVLYGTSMADGARLTVHGPSKPWPLDGKVRYSIRVARTGSRGHISVQSIQLTAGEAEESLSAILGEEYQA